MKAELKYDFKSVLLPRRDSEWKDRDGGLSVLLLKYLLTVSLLQLLIGVNDRRTDRPFTVSCAPDRSCAIPLKPNLLVAKRTAEHRFNR